MDKLRVGILGLRRGLAHLRNFLALEEAEVVGACDRLEACRTRARDLLDGAGVRVLNEFDDLLDLQPDAVIVASNGKRQAAHATAAPDEDTSTGHGGTDWKVLRPRRTRRALPGGKSPIHITSTFVPSLL